MADYDLTDDSSGSDIDLESKVQMQLCSIKKFNESLDYLKCLICQKYDKSLVTAQTQSKIKLIQCIKIRASVTSNIKSVHHTLYNNINDIKRQSNLLWHKECYSSYTSQRNIKAYKTKHKQATNLKIVEKLNDTTSLHIQDRLLRRNVYSTKLCVFCQKRLKEKKLSQVLTSNIEKKIKLIASKSYPLLSRIGQDDLIAAEVKYHSTCFLAAWKNYNKCPKLETSDKKPFDERSFRQLLDEMYNGFAKGKGFTTKSVYIRFKDISKDSTVSERCLIKRIIKNLEGVAEIIKPKRVNEPRIIMPKLTTSQLVNSFIDFNQESDTYRPVLQNVSENSILHKICCDIKRDMNNIPAYKEYRNLDNKKYKKYVPENLYLLISLLISDNDVDQTKVLNICQDIIFSYRKGKIHTPKHVGLGILVHQETKSKKLIETLHACGHSVSYKDVLRLRNTIAQEEINLYVENDNVIIPRQLVPNRFIQFAADNIDILEETLDKSPTFHGTQLAAFQRGPPNNEISKELKLLPYKVKLTIPEDFHSLEKIYYNKTLKPTPIVSGVKENITNSSTDDKFIKSQNISWLICRLADLNSQNESVIPQWTGFNKLIHCSNFNTTTYGYLPLIPYVASEYDTIWTVLQKCSTIAEKLNNKYTVITFDQAIYHKAKEIQWLKPNETQNVIIRLGGFHIMMNFLKVIGEHMEKSGLGDIWLESGLYGEATIQGILNGKKWNKAIRAHKLTYESLMRILIPIFENWLLEVQSDAIHDLNLLRLLSNNVFQNLKMKADAYSSFATMSEEASTLLEELENFINSQCPTFKYWYSYLELIETLLEFMYGERNANWELHLNGFRKMLPWFFTYNHTNYSRWGTIYLLDMNDLPTKAPEVYKEFKSGNFVVKRLEGSFNQLSVDQALEHINKNAKDAGGIVGLTKNSTRLDEWFLSFNEIGVMIDTFRSSLNICNGNISQNIESGCKRISVDEEAVFKLINEFNRFGVFSRTEPNLLCVSTNEIATKNIEESLLSAKAIGETNLQQFMEVVNSQNFYKPLKKNKSLTFKNIRVNQEEKKVNPKKPHEQGQEYLQKILAAKAMGRKIDYEHIFNHELTLNPMALAQNGVVNTPANKSALGHIIEEHTRVYKELPTLQFKKTCYIFDGMSLVQGLGKPPSAKTFEDYSKYLKNIVFKNPFNADRIDVVLDNYKEMSIKNCTRIKRGGSQGTIDRIIDNPNIRLPQQWHLFIHSIHNKRELTHFLSEQLYKESLKRNVKFVTSGGNKNILKYQANFELSSDILCSTHEEADTRILLHILSAKEEGYNRCIIDCKDTDVLVLLAHFKDKLTEEVWLKVGSKSNTKFIAIHEINLEKNIAKNLPALHALSGCDTTSQLTGFGKKAFWNIFLNFNHLLDDVGVADKLDNAIFQCMEKFVIALYTNETISNINQLRGILATSRSITKLPPTKNSLWFHCLRVHYQTKIWINALNPRPALPDVTENGWEIKNQKLLPILCTETPFPKEMGYLATCKCKKGCSGLQCSCRKNNIVCIGSCKCMAQSACKNSAVYLRRDSSSDEEDSE